MIFHRTNLNISISTSGGIKAFRLKAVYSQNCIVMFCHREVFSPLTPSTLLVTILDPHTYCPTVFTYQQLQKKSKAVKQYVRFDLVVVQFIIFGNTFGYFVTKRGSTVIGLYTTTTTTPNLVISYLIRTSDKATIGSSAA